MPRDVEVVYLYRGFYGVYVWKDNQSVQVFKGNREEVHSWLGQNGYKAVLPAVLSGAYRREGLGVSA